MVAEQERDQIINNLKTAVLEADYDSAPKITKQALDMGISPDALMDALGRGIFALEKKLYGDCKVWMHPDLFLAMEGVRQSMVILESVPQQKGEKVGTVVLGTPEGDVHDFGGKMVNLALMAAGFEVSYLGRDVPVTRFIHEVQAKGADILAISCYQTSNFKKIEEILDLLSRAGLRDKVYVLLGGCVITEKYAEKMNVGYGKTASDAVKLAQGYIRRIKS
jgi:methylmalonyl-CoA mutase cobalamin-binding domain/chain